MITVGIDMGSRTVKVVFLEELDVPDAPQLKWGVKGKHMMFPDDLDMDVAAEKALADGMAAAGIRREQITRIVSTGAGRKQVKFANDDEVVWVKQSLRRAGRRPRSLVRSVWSPTLWGFCLTDRNVCDRTFAGN